MRAPRIRVLSLGGTIASARRRAGGVLPSLDADSLVRQAAPPSSWTVRTQALRRVRSADVGPADLADIVRAVEAGLGEGDDGFVVTLGTDTLEEVAFALDLMLRQEAPVVVTGAMRDPTRPGADGPANLAAALRVAATPAARGLGTLVVMNDEVHAARFVRKAHTTRPDAFTSAPLGPLGWISEGEVSIRLRPVGELPHLPSLPKSPPPRVAVVTAALFEDGDDVRTLPERGYAALVVQALGGGHVPSPMADALGDVAARIPVVLSSRTGAGPVLTRTYGAPGAEIDLLRRGLIPARWLGASKARILLLLLLAAGADLAAIRRTFASL
ncbi:MAG: asparaginase [Actinomycetia bacterium]|nr:asparaginase [Actinomycetes bacterium]